jgi:ubiquinone/menaquinone biosynthesis C-methylase UbiE
MHREIKVLSGFSYQEFHVTGPDNVPVPVPSMNRSLEEVNYSLSRLPLVTIVSMLSQRTNPIAVLDLGSGWEANAARDLVNTYGPRVKATVVDVVLLVDEGAYGDIQAVLGDATQIPLPDKSQDIVISSNVVRWFSPERKLAALREVVRVLNDGGSAFVNINLHDFDNAYELRDLETELGVKVEKVMRAYPPTLVLTKPNN